MGICGKCFQMLPPDIMTDIDGTDGKGKECAFCKAGKTSIKLPSGQEYTKDECIRDYQKLLRKLKDNPKIAEKLIKKK